MPRRRGWSYAMTAATGSSRARSIPPPIRSVPTRTGRRWARWRARTPAPSPSPAAASPASIPWPSPTAAPAPRTPAGARANLELGSAAVKDTGTGAGDVPTVGDADTLYIAQGKHTLWVPALAMKPWLDAPCGDPADYGGGFDHWVGLPFDAAANEGAMVQIAAPKSWDEGTLAFQVIWAPCRYPDRRRRLGGLCHRSGRRRRPAHGVGDECRVADRQRQRHRRRDPRLARGRGIDHRRRRGRSPQPPRLPQRRQLPPTPIPPTPCSRACASSTASTPRTTADAGGERPFRIRRRRRQDLRRRPRCQHHRLRPGGRPSGQPRLGWCRAGHRDGQRQRRGDHQFLVERRSPRSPSIFPPAAR